MVQCVPVATVTGPLRAVVMSQQQGNPAATALGLPHDLSAFIAFIARRLIKLMLKKEVAKFESQ